MYMFPGSELGAQRNSKLYSSYMYTFIYIYTYIHIYIYIFKRYQDLNSERKEIGKLHSSKHDWDDGVERLKQYDDERHALVEQVDTATHCNTLQHTATHCNTPQHTATHCHTLQYEDERHGLVEQKDTATHCNTLQHAATHRNILQHNATYCNMRTSDMPWSNR